MNANELSAGRPEGRKRTETEFWMLVEREEQDLIFAVREQRFYRQMRETDAERVAIPEAEAERIRFLLEMPDQPDTDVTPVVGA